MSQNKTIEKILLELEEMKEKLFKQDEIILQLREENKQLKEEIKKLKESANKDSNNSSSNPIRISLSHFEWLNHFQTL